MLSVSLRTFCRMEKCVSETCLSRMIQTLPVLNKRTVPNVSLYTEKRNVLGNANEITEISLNDEQQYIRPKSISSSYINESKMLQKLFGLNVDLYKVETNKEAYNYISQRNFDDIKGHIIFFKELNLEEDEIGNIISKNPMILKENIEDLNIRINYLKYKKFTNSMITNIIKKNPFWLSYW